MSIFDELKRRNVFRVGAAYAIGAWLLAQVADLVLENFDSPAWIIRTLLIVLASGFPLALILAWVFEVTPQGVKKESEVAQDRSITRSTGRKLDRLIIVALIVALGYFVWESRFTTDQADSDTPQVQATKDRTSEAETTEQDTTDSIAVLPFENFSDDPNDTYFADGLADTLLHKLAQVHDLRVIARNSSFQFKGSNRDIREIGRILDVETVLEGSVQRYGDQVRVIAQLINAEDGAHLWSGSFDGTLANIFSLQDKIAEDIVGELKINLSDDDLERLLRNSTDSTEAYDLYMQASAQSENTDQLAETSEASFTRLSLLKQAVEIDPQFALAWASIAQAYNALAFASMSADLQTEYIEKGKRAVARAIELDPDLAGAYVAKGFIHWRERDLIQAEKAQRKALELNPNSSGALTGLGLILIRRDPQEAYRMFTRVAELDPEAVLVYRQMAFALQAMGNLDGAVESLQEGLRRFPDEYLFVDDLSSLAQITGAYDKSSITLSGFLQNNGLRLNAAIDLARNWLAVGDIERGSGWLALITQRFGESDASHATQRRIFRMTGEISNAQQWQPPTEDNRFAYINWQILQGGFCIEQKDWACAAEVSQYLQLAYEELRAKGNNWVTMTDIIEFIAANGFLGTGREAEGEALLHSLSQRMAAYPLFGRNLRDAHKGYLYPAVLFLLNEEDAAYQALNDLLSPAGFTIDAMDWFGIPPEHSPLFSQQRQDERFQEWLAKFIERRENLREKMIELESDGVIISLQQAKRMEQ